MDELSRVIDTLTGIFLNISGAFTSNKLLDTMSATDVLGIVRVAHKVGYLYFILGTRFHSHA